MFCSLFHFDLYLLHPLRGSVVSVLSSHSPDFDRICIALLALFPDLHLAALVHSYMLRALYLLVGDLSGSFGLRYGELICLASLDLFLRRLDRFDLCRCPSNRYSCDVAFDCAIRFIVFRYVSPIEVMRLSAP